MNCKLIFSALLLYASAELTVSESASSSKVNSALEAPNLPGLLNEHKRVVVCSLSLEASHRSGQGAFNLKSNLDCRLCTHILYTGLLLDGASGRLQQFAGFNSDTTNLKKQCPHIKLLLSVSQSNGTSAFSTVAANANLRNEFARNVHGYVTDFQVDGLDLDLNMEDAISGNNTSNKINIATLIKDLKNILGSGTILTASLSKEHSIIDSSYDIPTFIELLDYLHVKSFGYHGAWDGRTGPSSPLRSMDSSDTNTMVSTIEHFKSLGVPKEKLVLGVPLFGSTFLLQESTGNQVQPFGTKIDGAGQSGPYTAKTGFIGYNEICLELTSKNNSWSVSWDSVSKTPYAQNKKQWVSYEDRRSISEKVRYAVKANLAGVMVWTVDLDDFRGDCNKWETGVHFKYPLLNEVHTSMVKATHDGEEYDYISSTSSRWGIANHLIAALIICLRFIQV